MSTHRRKNIYNCFILTQYNENYYHKSNNEDPIIQSRIYGASNIMLQTGKTKSVVIEIKIVVDYEEARKNLQAC